MIVIPQTSVESEALWHFMNRHGVVLPIGTDLRFMGRVEGERLIGVVAYNGFNGRTCAMHMAGDGNWISREFLFAAFDYPFRQLNLALVFGMLAGDNDRALRLDKHLGFEVLHRIRHGWNEQTDLVVVGMHKAQCRWITPLRGAKHG